MTWEEICDAIIAADKRGYAASYAKAGKSLSGEARRVQGLYILGNLQSWRGEEARKVKAELKRICQL